MKVKHNIWKLEMPVGEIEIGECFLHEGGIMMVTTNQCGGMLLMATTNDSNAAQAHNADSIIAVCINDGKMHFFDIDKLVQPVTVTAVVE